MGRADRPKGLLKTEDPAKKIIPLTQDLNYYFQKGSYYHRKNKLSKALLFLKRAIEIEPLNVKSHYRLACLLSQSSRLREANRVFTHLVKNLDPELTECYYMMAINYGLMDNMDKARRYLEKYLQLSPDGVMAEEAGDLLAVIEESTAEEDYVALFTSQENEALEQWLAIVDRENLQYDFLDEPFNAFLQRALYQGSDLVKEGIILLCGGTRSEAGTALLKEFVANPWIRERLRQVALLKLKNSCPDSPVQLFSEGRLVETELADYEPAAPVWQKEWQEVLDCLRRTMQRQATYGDKYYEDARAIWFDFVNEIYPKMPRIVKPETWAAGVEYCLARFHLLSITQEQLAAAYRVSTSSVGRRYKQIDTLLKIEQKAFRKMLALLAHHELDD